MTRTVRGNDFKSIIRSDRGPSLHKWTRPSHTVSSRAQRLHLRNDVKSGNVEHCVEVVRQGGARTSRNTHTVRANPERLFGKTFAANLPLVVAKQKERRGTLGKFRKFGKLGKFADGNPRLCRANHGEVPHDILMVEEDREYDEQHSREDPDDTSDDWFWSW